MPTEPDKLSPARRAFLSFGYFSRRGRERLAAAHAEQGRPPPGKISLDSASCLAWQRMTCLSCSSACPENAIGLVANQQPQIDSQRCTGCANCAAACPAGAIHIAILGNH